jgi:hypothetical protein
MIEDLARWVDTLPAIVVWLLALATLAAAQSLNYLALRHLMRKAARHAAHARLAARLAATHRDATRTHLTSVRKLHGEHQTRKRALRRSVWRGEDLTVPTRRTDGLHRAEGL